MNRHEEQALTDDIEDHLTHQYGLSERFVNVTMFHIHMALSRHHARRAEAARARQHLYGKMALACGGLAVLAGILSLALL